MDVPLLAITMGDPAGIGPETIVGAWADEMLHQQCRAVVVGHPTILRRAVSLLGSPAEVAEVGSPDELRSNSTTIPCIAAGSDDITGIEPGKIDAQAGQAAYEAVVTAAELARRGHVDAITTAPINKAALRRAGHRYPGHTELLAELCGVDNFAMMLYLGPGGLVRGPRGLGVVHATLHTALRDVPDQLTVEGIVAKAHLADAALRAGPGAAVHCGAPRIGVCALNPHAGEEALFGDEERRIIEPAVRRGLAEGLTLTGPLPADTLMARAAGGEFDAVVAMYHDQGHIALKLLGLHRTVNVTLGLPIIRTSVAHGTAFDLAWQGRAETGGMREAIRLASILARQRRHVASNPDVVAEQA